MTVEKRVFISPADLIGIEYECEHCHAKHLVPFASFDRVLYQCPNCKEGMATASNPNRPEQGDDAILHHFAEALGNLKNLSVKIRLQITDELHVAGTWRYDGETDK
ncbi:MAG TPA: hypothetical protein VHX11_08995 [Acidobacteriaceae bacterium]|jgi:hypothetical protein|nr:hypothetical protein [Acidobacteriaceae bacterium]